MRTWLSTFVVLVLAVALALVLRAHSGNVIIVAQPWRIELSLTLAVLLVLAAFVLLYVLVRVLSWLWTSPERLKVWRGRRARSKDHELLEAGWITVLEGRFDQAEHTLSRLLGRTRSSHTRVLAGLALARASHQLGEFARRDDALRVAHDAAAGNTRLQEATVTVEAEMYLDQNRPQDALALLQPLHDANPRYSNATRLLLWAHRLLNHPEEVYKFTRLLQRQGVMDRTQAQGLIEASAAARLQAAGIEGYKAIWSDLKADEKALPAVAMAAAAVQEAAGNTLEAGKILETALSQKLDAGLLNAYSQCPPDQVARRIAKAEVWLKQYPDHSDLLAALGNLCLTGQLWGAGERYLLRSMKLRSDVRIHALLGNLYDRLGREADAMKHWRLASGVAGVLPVLHVNTVLPAADTRSDPTLIDAGALSDAQPVTAATPMPVAASAADFLSDDAESSAADRARQGPSVAHTPQADWEEYLDSAPIPGIDLSQTGDGSSRDRH